MARECLDMRLIFPFNCETMHIARHLNYPMSIVFDTLMPGRSCLCLVLSPSHSCGRPPKERLDSWVNTVQLSSESLASHRKGKREAWASQPVSSSTSLRFLIPFQGKLRTSVPPYVCLLRQGRWSRSKWKNQGLPSTVLF